MSQQEIIYGLHAVEAVLQHAPWRIKKLYVYHARHDKRFDDILKLAQKSQIHHEHLSEERMNAVSQHGLHQGVIAICQPEKALSEEAIDTILQKSSQNLCFLILDGIQDPHNLGACLRVANAAGVDMVIAPKHHAVGLTSVVRKVASGAVETTPFVQVTNLSQTIRKFKEAGVWCYGASHDADKTLYDIDLKGNIALLFGAEGSGLRHLTRELCDDVLSIPMFGEVSSLNVSVAAGICLYEAVRQRNKNVDFSP